MAQTLPANADVSSIPGSERSLGVGNGNPLQYSCLENSMDRGNWWTIQAMGPKRVWHNWACMHIVLRIEWDTLCGVTSTIVEWPAQLFYRFSAAPIRISAGFFVEINKLILKFIWNFKHSKKSWKRQRYKISYKDISYNTGNIAYIYIYSQYIANNYKWNITFKNYKPLWYTWNLHNTVYQLYLNLKKN